MIGELLPRLEVPDALRSEMYSLMCGQFEGVGRDQFGADIAEKNWVILLREGDHGRLRGFSTLDVYTRTIDGAEVGIVYSGDTVVDGEPGMGSSLSKIWIGAVNSIRAEMGLDRLLWLLLTSGYRTYRFLPMYWRDFHPRYDASSSPQGRALREILAADRFGPLFDASAGIVRFPQPQRLHSGLRGIPPHRLDDPHVAFFAAANPGHEMGDELVCLTELTEANLTPAGRRMWSAGQRLFAAATSNG